MNNDLQNYYIDYLLFENGDFESYLAVDSDIYTSLDFCLYIFIMGTITQQYIRSSHRGASRSPVAGYLCQARISHTNYYGAFMQSS